MYPVLERIEEVVRGGGALNTEDLFFRNCVISVRRGKGWWGYSRERTGVFLYGIFIARVTEYEELQERTQNDYHRELSKLSINTVQEE